MIKVLFASRFVEPTPAGYGQNVYRQARYLSEAVNDVSLEVLTWPLGDGWKGFVPHSLCDVAPPPVTRGGVRYRVFRAPIDWNETTAVISDAAWEAAVRYGMDLLRQISPDIVHLQHRHGLWWILESAQRLGIPTIYSNHDWGLACMRTVLVTGDGALCDANVEPGRCSQCVKSGRGVVGRVNEEIAEFKFGRALVRYVDEVILDGRLKSRGCVTESAKSRAQSHFARAGRAISNLAHCITPSNFGADFFCRLGCKREKITVLPWYSDLEYQPSTRPESEPFTITYVGRVSPEKGVDLIFRALEMLRGVDPIQLRIAGANESSYCVKLRRKFARHVGIHHVQWLGWSEVGPLLRTTDIAIIPSRAMDNTPLSLVEALATGTPVVATNVPSIAEMLVEGQTGYLAELGSADSLAAAMRRAVSNKDMIRARRVQFPPTLRLPDYMNRVVSIYRHVAAARC